MTARIGGLIVVLLVVAAAGSAAADPALDPRFDGDEPFVWHEAEQEFRQRLNADRASAGLPALALASDMSAAGRSFLAEKFIPNPDGQHDPRAGICCHRQLTPMYTWYSIQHPGLREHAVEGALGQINDDVWYETLYDFHDPLDDIGVAVIVVPEPDQVWERMYWIVYLRARNDSAPTAPSPAPAPQPTSSPTPTPTSEPTAAPAPTATRLLTPAEPAPTNTAPAPPRTDPHSSHRLATDTSTDKPAPTAPVAEPPVQPQIDESRGTTVNGAAATNAPSGPASRTPRGWPMAGALALVVLAVAVTARRRSRQTSPVD